MLAVVTFIIVFGILVTVHEFGHFYAAKKSGILVREFSIGMGPKIFFYRKNGTTYTLRILPLGGYVRMAGTEDDDNEIKPGTFATITLDSNNVVERLNFSSKNVDINAIPVQFISADLVDDLKITVYENGDESIEKEYNVNHDALIVEEDGTELLIAPRDVQFQSATLLRRAITNFAGPFNNLLLSIVAFFIVAVMMGGIQTPDSNKIGTIMPNSAAQKAGLQVNDQIEKVNGKKTKSFTDIQKQISKSNGSKLKLTVERHSQDKTLYLKPKAKKGSKNKVIGIGPQIDKSFNAKVKYAFKQPFAIAGMILTVIGHMFTHGFDINQFSGPVGMYSLTSEVASRGLVTIIGFVGMLSINLGVMNLIPIPALDGGKLLLNLIEAIRRKPIPEEKEGIINLIGVALLVILMLAVTWNDIQRFFIQ